METSKLKENTNNPRTITTKQMEKLKNSIQAFPEMLHARPIVVDPHMRVLGGNMRLKACRLLNIKEVPVYVATWDEAKQRRFIIADNLQHGEWDWDELGNNHDPLELLDWGLTIPWDEEPEDEPKEPKQCKHCEKMIP